jgi:hypothetical protein
MKSLSIKLMLPVVAFVLASAGAVSTSGSTAKSALAPIQGWKRTAPFQCSAVRDCNNETGPVCMNGADQLYGKATPTSDCTLILTHKVQP